MKAEELMIGDYVRLKKNKETVYIFEIDGDRDVINNEADGYCSERNIRIGDIEPIPLTAEVLEKNGFRRLGEQYDIWTLMTLSLNCKNGMFGYYEQGNPYNPTFNVKYVHELQHALRLFKIDKEIEL